MGDRHSQLSPYGDYTKKERVEERMNMNYEPSKEPAGMKGEETGESSWGRN